MLNMFIKIWKGEAPLWIAFWIVYFIIGTLISMIIILFISNFSADYIRMMRTNLGSAESISFFNTVRIILFPYTVFSVICVWRCAKNSWVVWSMLTRFYMIIVILYTVFSITYFIINR